MNKIFSLAKSLFFKNRHGEKNIFAHDANGEPCAVCGKPMRTEQGIVRVGSGEKMHSDCWPKFFEMRVEHLKDKYRNQA